jgi:hypothetical protein
MNSVQDLFVFEVLFGEEDGFKLPRENENKESLGSSFCKGITEFIKGNQEKGWNETDYWIGITSKEPKEITGETTTTTQYIYRIEYPKTKTEEEPKRNVHIITSKDWEKKYCPPSLFEYLVLAVFICCGRSLIDDLVKLPEFEDVDIPPDPHNSLGMTGCLCDKSIPQEQWRIRISNPSICFPCKARLRQIEKKIPDKHLIDQINRVLSRAWMGSPDSRDTPLYNLRKNYGYNVDHNSGFNKKWPEKILDSIIEDTAKWIIGGIGVGVVTSLLVTLVNHVFPR